MSQRLYLLPLFLLAMTGHVSADIVHNDDVIINGGTSSLCTGVDCINGENFGFDTIRLKENNLRIKFDDTSVGSFPSNDWQITINETSNGGLSKFSIDDVTNSKTPFTIEANAPSNSLYVDNGGRLGLGTSNPVVELQVVDGDTPTLRLEQDNSSGFTPQTWDVAGNEAGFFIRDVTNGSQLSLRIRPGAPASSIDISSTGNVGIGNSAPEEKLHIRRSEANDMGDGLMNLAKLSANNTTATPGKVSDSGFLLENEKAGFEWSFRTLHNKQGFGATKLGTGGAEFAIENTSNDYTQVILRLGSGARNQNGQWINASSREYKENIKDLTAAAAVSALDGLTPVTYTFKNDAEKDMNVGFIAEDVPALVSIPGRKGLNPLEITAMLTRVVKEQQKTLEQQQKTLEQQQKLLDMLLEERTTTRQTGALTTSMLTR